MPAVRQKLHLSSCADFRDRLWPPLRQVRDHHNDLITATGLVNTSANLTREGWTVGIGGEYRFAPNWSAFIEYDYLGFGNKSVSFAGAGAPFSFKIDQHIQTLEAGINYRFNWGDSLF